MAPSKTVGVNRSEPLLVSKLDTNKSKLVVYLISYVDGDYPDIFP